MNSNQDLHNALSREASRIEEDANYSGKAHLNAATIWSNRHYWLGIPATIAGVMTGAAIVKDYQVAAGILSLFSTILAGLVTFLKPYERASQHKSIGDLYLSLRNEARIFREIEILENKDIDTLSESLRILSSRRNSLNCESPEIPRKAFEKARKGIEEGESVHEIDRKTR